MSLMLWPVRPKKHPPIPHFAKVRLKAAPAKVGIAVIGNLNPVTAASAAVLCAPTEKNVSDARP
jgi:hypothetical protein